MQSRAETPELAVRRCGVMPETAHCCPPGGRTASGGPQGCTWGAHISTDIHSTRAMLHSRQRCSAWSMSWTSPNKNPKAHQLTDSPAGDNLIWKAGRHVGSCFMEKSCRKSWAAWVHPEGSPLTWRSGVPSHMWGCLAAWLCRFTADQPAREGRGQASILASLVLQGSLKPRANLFATRGQMQHANMVLNTGQASRTAENYFLHVKNIPMGWNKQN